MNTDCAWKAADEYYAAQEAELSRRCVCQKCGEHIADDCCYKVEEGIYWCSECMNKELDRRVDEYAIALTELMDKKEVQTPVFE